MDLADFAFELTFREGTFRYVDGFRIGLAEPARGAELFLVEDPDDRYPQMRKTYRPFEAETGLFLALARRDATKESLQEFSHNYGPLITTVRAVRADNGERFQGMPLGDLVTEVTRLKRAVTAWENQNEAAVMKAAMLGFGGDLRAVLNRPSKDSPLVVKLCPQSLMDALWVQLLLAVVQNKSFRDCVICKKPYEVSPSTNRVTRSYCSNACRNKAQRRRITKAKEMRADGKSLQYIADAYNTSLEIVKGWVESD